MLDSAPGGIADTSRSLAYLDTEGGGPRAMRVRPKDRNARLFLVRGR